MRRSVLLAMSVFAFVGCAKAKGETERPSKPSKKTTVSQGTRVEVARLSPSQPRLDLVLPGEVEGARDALVASRSGGYVEKVLTKTGDTVRAGQSLAHVDRITASLSRDQAKIAADRARSESERVTKAGAALSKARREAADFALRSAETSLSLAERAYATTLTRAPFSGVVAKVMVEQGEVLPPGGPVARLVQLDPAVVSITVSDRDVVSLEPGIDVLVTAAAQATGVDAKIARISPVADINTRAFRVEIDVPNPKRALLPGMIVTVSLSVQLEPNLLSIPQYVLVTRRDGNGVFVLEDGVARWRSVTLGRVVRDRVIIRSGVKVGEDVIVTGHRELADGDRVIVARKGTCCTRGRVDFGDDG